jgi:hypothetical protein
LAAVRRVCCARVAGEALRPCGGNRARTVPSTGVTPFVPIQDTVPVQGSNTRTPAS